MVNKAKLRDGFVPAEHYGSSVVPLKVECWEIGMLKNVRFITTRPSLRDIARETRARAKRAFTVTRRRRRKG